MFDTEYQFRTCIFFLFVTGTVSQVSSSEVQPTMSPISSQVSSNPFSDEDIGNGKGNEGSQGNEETLSPVAAPALVPTAAPIAAPTLEPTWAPIAAPTLQPTMKLYQYGKGKGSNRSYDGTCYIGEHHCPCRHIDNGAEGTCDSPFVCDEHDRCHVNHTCYHRGEHFCPCTDNGTCDVGLVCDEHDRCHLNHTGKGKGNITNNTDECYIGSKNCRCSTGGTCDIGLHCSVDYTCMELMHNISGYNIYLSGQSTVQKTVGYISLSIVGAFFIVLVGFKLLKMFVGRKVSCHNGVLLEDMIYAEAGTNI